MVSATKKKGTAKKRVARRATRGVKTTKKTSSKKTDMCVYIKCPPMRIKGSQYVGKTISELRIELKDQLEVPNGAPASLSTDCGKSFGRVNDSYKTKNQDMVEFGRGSSQKG